MFVGAINETVRKYLYHSAEVLDGAALIVGRSGNFTLENTIQAAVKPAAVHSNDVSLYSSALGTWLAGGGLEFEIKDQVYDWLIPYMDNPEQRIAVLMVLMDMLEYEKRDNAHRVRMWDQYSFAFQVLVQGTADKLRALQNRIDSYFVGDVLEHFERFSKDEDAVFCCYAPTCSGGYERMFKRLESIFSWRAPTYTLLDDRRRSELLAWMIGRKYIWFDDRLIDGLDPVMKQQSSSRHAVWAYSNILRRPALFAGMETKPLPRWPIATRDNLALGADTEIWLKQIKTSDLLRFKEAYLGRNISPSSGMWGFAVMADALIIGFMEFSYSEITARDQVYMMADFCVPGTPYKRLSRLIVALAVCGQTGSLLTRLKEYPVRAVRTTAFTDHAVSMKYRGIMKLEKRGEKDGKKFLNYYSRYNNATWKEVYRAWWTKNGSITR